MANAKGVDVSHWQSLSDWSTTGLSFVIVKASEGLTKDAMFAKHVAKGRAAGLVVGAYAFNRDDVNIAAQAKFFADNSKGVDLWFIDVEGTHAFSQAQTKLFIATFKAYTGKHIGLYHSASGYFEAGQDYDWVAHWGVSAPSRSWDFHQYRGAPLDLDQYNGTKAQLQSFVQSLNGGNMPNLTLYTPGYTTTLKQYSNIRSEPKLGSATLIRTVPKGGSEDWTITGWVKGDVDPDSGSDKWVTRWFNNRWEYTAEYNLAAPPAKPECPPCPDPEPCPPPTADDCKVFSDAAYTQGKTDGLAEGQAIGYETGYREGYLEGFDNGFIEGREDGIPMGVASEQERIKGVLGLE